MTRYVSQWLKDVHFRQVIVLSAIGTNIGVFIKLVQFCYYELECAFYAKSALHLVNFSCFYLHMHGRLRYWLEQALIAWRVILARIAAG